MVYVERGEPGYPQPQFHPPAGYLAEFVPGADMNHQLYKTFFDRAFRNYLYRDNPKYPGTSIPMYMVDHPFFYRDYLLNYPRTELAKVSQNNAMFNVWWNQAGFTRPVKNIG